MSDPKTTDDLVQAIRGVSKRLRQAAERVGTPHGGWKILTGQDEAILNVIYPAAATLDLIAYDLVNHGR